MRNPFSALFRARDKPRDSVSAAPTFYFGTSGSGKPVNANTAIQLSTVYACVRVISESVASLPLGVYESKDDGNRKATEHPLYPLLHDEPNSEMTSFVLREVMLAHLLLWGNSYCQIIRSGRNQITGLYPLLPDMMTVDRDKKGILAYTYMTSTGETVILSPDDVLHIPGLGFDGVMGYSPIALEKNAIGLGIASEEYGSKFFSNGARPSGILTNPNTVKNPKALRESWNSAYGGSSNTGASFSSMMRACRWWPCTGNTASTTWSTGTTRFTKNRCRTSRLTYLGFDSQLLLRQFQFHPPVLQDQGFPVQRSSLLLCLELEVPDNEVLLSDFHAWHFVLNRWPISDTEEESTRIDEFLEHTGDKEAGAFLHKNWERALDIRPFENDWTSRGNDVQATFWELKREYVKKVRPFVIAFRR